MQSVFEQTFTDYEYIIIDGGSTDGSKEYIEQHADKLAYWVSEKDGGIYDALNKGSKVANGEYLHHLNSGDTYYDDDVLKNLFSKQPQEDFIYGNQNLVGLFLKNYPSELSFEFFCRDTVPHQATIIKRTFFEKVDGFSLNYYIVADYRFFLEAVYLHQCSYAYVDITLVNYDMTGLSNSVNPRQLVEEFAAVRTETIPNLVKEFTELYEERKRLIKLQNSRIVKFGNKFKKLLPNL